MDKRITFADVAASGEIRTYIDRADVSLKALGYTEHSYTHVTKCAETASLILEKLGYPERDVDLARIAAYMHDIGNVINRVNHAQTGAVMAFRILDNIGMCAEDVSAVITAIGNHDEDTAAPVSAIAAALILADKTDVRRTRVRNSDIAAFDIHDRVNYSVYGSSLDIDPAGKTVTLDLQINTEICSVMDYFEIFLKRMLLCRRAADFLGLRFRIVINGQALL